MWGVLEMVMSAPRWKKWFHFWLLIEYYVVNLRCKIIRDMRVMKGFNGKLEK